MAQVEYFTLASRRFNPGVLSVWFAYGLSGTSIQMRRRFGLKSIAWTGLANYNRDGLIMERDYASSI